MGMAEGGLRIFEDPRVPLGDVWVTDGKGNLAKVGRFNRECGQGAEGGCELGLGHPGGECMGRGPRGEYLVWEQGTGRLLREL